MADIRSVACETNQICQGWTIILQPRIFAVQFAIWKLKLTLSDPSDHQTYIYLCVKALPPKMQSVQVERTYTLSPGDVKHSYDCEITRKKMCAVAWPESDGPLARKAIEKYNEYTIRVDVELSAVYDRNSNDITEQYLREEAKVSDNPGDAKTALSPLNSAKLDSLVVQMENLSAIIHKMQSKVDRMELRLDEE